MNGIQRSTIKHMVTRFRNERNLDATYDVCMLGSYAYVQFHVSTPNPFPELRVGAKGGWWSDEIRSYSNPAMDSLLYADDLLANQSSGKRRRAASAQHVPLVADRQRACELLAGIVRCLASRHHKELKELKMKYAQDIEKPDFVWRSLVESASDHGGSRGTALYEDPGNYDKITFEALSILSASERHRVLAKTTHASKVRWPNRKATSLAKNVEIIRAMGGPAAAKVELLAKTTRAAKISFLKQFKGIGDKYARNIFMNLYHPQFRQSIAVDARIDSISKELGLSLKKYTEKEQFYLDVARKAGINGWKLDRLIYTFKDEVFRCLRQRAQDLELKEKVS